MKNGGLELSDAQPTLHRMNYIVRVTHTNHRC